VPFSEPIIRSGADEVDLFLPPTMIRPGRVLAVAHASIFASQIGPTVAGSVSLKLIAPGGSAQAYTAETNEIRSFWMPETT
jgi:hypothetical protein